MTTRLPLRIEPLPGEWWRGYLERVGSAYGVRPYVLLGQVADSGGLHRRQLRWSGIAIGDAAARRLAATFSLTIDEIQDMHLSVYDGAVLHFRDFSPAVFDSAVALPTEPLSVRAVGPLVNAVRDRYCIQCVTEVPGFRAMSWRLRLHLVCTRHGTLLATDRSASDEAIAAPARVIDCQKEVLARLTPSLEHAAFFTDLDALLSPSISRWRARLDHLAQEKPENVLESFATAVQRVLSPGYPDYQGLANWPTHAAASTVRAPSHLGFDGVLHRFPHLLPTHLFTKGLSDLLVHQVQIRPARAVAAVGALLCATGHSLDEATVLLPERRRASTSARLLEQLIQLEREGRAERFWALCTAAAVSLIKEEVDYRHREQVCSDEEAYLIATAAEPSAYVRTVRTWLVDQWACTYTSSNVRPSVRDGSIEHFDRLYGPGMRAALARLVEESAA